MDELDPRKARRLEKAARLMEDGEIAMMEHLIEIEERLDEEVPQIKDVISRVRGDAGPKGKKGDRGEKGDRGPAGKDGRDGRDGKDGLDGASGRDGVDGADGLDGKDGRDGQDFTPDLRELAISTINVLESFEGEDRLDAKAIKNLPEATREIIRTSGGGEIEVFGASGKVGSGAALRFTGTGVTLSNTDGHTTVVDISSGGGAGTVTSVDVSGGTTGLTFSGGPVTTSGTITMSGTLGPANGGTGVSSAFTAGSVIFSNGTTLAQDNSNFFWDDSNNRLGIGTSSPSQQLTLSGTNTSVQIANASNENSYFGTFPTLFQFSYNRIPATGVIPNSSQSAAYVNVQGGAGASAIGLSVASAVNTQPIEMLRITTSSTIFNDLGGDMDFRIEGDTDASLFVTDAGLDRVGIGTASPGDKLTVNGGLLVTGVAAGGNGAHFDFFSGRVRFFGYNYGPNTYYPVNVNDSMLVAGIGNVGIGNVNTLNAQSLLYVQGNAAIGSGYNGTAAPTNGLIVEGNTGIGASSSTAKLTIDNSADVSGGPLVIKRAPSQANSANSMLITDSSGNTLMSHFRYSNAGSVLRVQDGTRSFQMESYATDSNYFSADGATFAIRTLGAYSILFFTNTSTGRAAISDFSGHFIVGTNSTATNGDARLHSIWDSGPQLRLGQDYLNTAYMDATVASTTGITTFNAVGTTPAFVFSDPVSGNSFAPTSSTLPANGLYLPASNTLGWAINSAAEMQLTASALSPAANDGNALGTSSLSWADLFLASGAVINIANGNYTLTHSTGVLTASADFRISSVGTNTNSVPTISSSSTLTNKRIQPRSSTASSGDVTPDLATANVWQRTALSAGVTINAPTGTPVLGETIVIMLLDNGTSRSITWNSAYTTRVMGSALPTATTISKQLLVTCQYNGTTWLCLSSTEI